MQDTLTYLPSEAHALGWQQHGRAKKLYTHLSQRQQPGQDAGVHSAAEHLELPNQKRSVQKAAQQSQLPAQGDNGAHITAQQVPLANQRGSVQNAAQRFELPGPFTARPRTGSRIFVQSHFPGIAGALAAEMLSWQEDTRTRSCPALPAPSIKVVPWLLLSSSLLSLALSMLCPLLGL